jgi:Spy/CpxP family protein refolding chaperone
MLRRMLSPFLFMVIALSTAVLAQETTKSMPPGSGRAIGINRLQHMKGPRRRLMRFRNLLGPQNRLNLTAEQKQQQRAILQSHLVATKSQREQLFQLREKRLDGTFTPEDQERAKALRQEIRNSMAGIRQETLNLLTPEQRSQLESIRLERKQRRQEMMNRRKEMMQNPPGN